MIQLNKNTNTEIVIFSSNFKYTIGPTYSIKLTNDIEQIPQYTDLIVSTYSNQYMSFKIIDTGLTGPSASLGEVQLLNSGFYTLDILQDNIIAYTERSQLTNINDEFIYFSDDDTYIFYKE